MFGRCLVGFTMHGTNEPGRYTYLMLDRYLFSVYLFPAHSYYLTVHAETPEIGVLLYVRSDTLQTYLLTLYAFSNGCIYIYLHK